MRGVDVLAGQRKPLRTTPNARCCSGPQYARR